jgi:hypothetical protein
MQQNPLAGIRFEQTTGVICEKCQNKTFNESYMLRKVSKFLLASSSEKDQLIPIPVFQCAKCGHVNNEFLPEALKDDNNENVGSSDDQQN